MILERKKELIELNRLQQSNKAEFLAIYGRRRIGKTYLISNFFNNENNIYFSLMGIKQGKEDDHKELFLEEIGSSFNQEININETLSWTKLFKLLGNEINKLKTNKKIIIFIDELPRFCANKSIFLEHLAIFWEQFAVPYQNIILIISGSSASWMIDNVINATGSLYDRITHTMELRQLSLEESKHYLQAKGINLSDKMIAELYMAFGGIPKYLDYIEKDDSATTAINRLYFKYNSILRNEFNLLFKSLYNKKATDYKTVLLSFTKELTIGNTIESLQQKHPNITKSTIRRIVNDLTKCGFLYKQEIIQHKKGNNQFLYFIVDNYSIFYLKWIHGKSLNQEEDFWTTQVGTPTWNSWKGLAAFSV